MPEVSGNSDHFRLYDRIKERLKKKRETTTIRKLDLTSKRQKNKKRSSRIQERQRVIVKNTNKAISKMQSRNEAREMKNKLHPSKKQRDITEMLRRNEWLKKP